MESVTDEILLLILQHLSTHDIKNVGLVNKRFNRISHDSSLHRNASFVKNRHLSSSIFHKYVAKHSSHLERLSLKECFWIAPGQILNALHSCKSLIRLNLIGSRLTIQGLLKIANNNSNLKWLGWSVPNSTIGNELHTDGKPTTLCLQIQNVLKGLNGIKLRFESLSSFEQLLPVFINKLHVYEFGLEYLSDRSSSYFSNGNMYGIFVRSAQRFPVCLNDVDNRFLHFNLLVMDFVIHMVTKAAETQSISVLMAPGTTNSLCWKYIHPVLQTKSFEQIDLSHSKLAAEQMRWLSSLQQLTHLNLSNVSEFKNNLLRAIAANCPGLLSLNLSRCEDWLDEDLCGLSAVANSCTELRELNLSGLHIHGSSDSLNCLCSIISEMKNLKSLGLPACGLLNNPNASEGSKSSCSKSSSHLHGSPRGNHAIGISALALPSSSSMSTSRLSGSPSKESMLSLPHPLTIDSSSGSYVTRHVSFKKRKDADVTRIGSGLDMLVKCEKIEELEIIDVGFHSVFSRLINNGEHYLCSTTGYLHDKAFSPVCQWTALRRLTIAGLSCLGSFSTLTEITAACGQLEYLSIAHVGQQGHSGSLSSLKQALQNCKKLITFRLDQPHYHITDSFLQAFQSCPRLEALCIINKDGKIPKEIDVYASLFDKSPRLAAFYLFSGGTSSLSRKIQSTITKMFQKSRPPLSVAVMPYFNALTEEGLKSVPYANLRDVIRFESHIALCKPHEDS